MKYMNAMIVTGMLAFGIQSTEAQVDCQNSTGLSSQEQEILDLIKNVTSVNEPIMLAAQRHADKIIQFLRNTEDMSHNDLQTLPIQFLNLIASLADSADGNKIEVTMEEQMTLLNEFSRLFLDTPNFLDILDTYSRTQVEKIINSVEKVEISHRTRGSYKGESRIKIHTKGNDTVKVNFTELGAMTGIDFALTELIIENEAEILFNDSEFDHRQRRKRDERIVDLVENATTRGAGGARMITEEQVNRTIEVIENQEYRSDNQPIYFKAEGIRIKSDIVGFGGKVSQGVVIPHIREDSNREAPSSMFVQVKATGALGLASVFGATIAL